MTTPTNDINPEKCFETGLTCGACTRETARQLAAVCTGLRGKTVGQLFVQLYPSSACAPMHGHFAHFYQEAAAGITEAVAAPQRPEFERREVGSARGRLPGRMMAAVA